MSDEKEAMRRAILGAADRPVEKLDVPAWGGPVYLRSVGGTERDQIDDLFFRDASGRLRNVPDVRAKVAAMVLSTSTGERLFTSSEADVAELSKKSGAILEQIFTAALRMNAIGGEAVVGAKKNSESGQAGASGSA